MTCCERICYPNGSTRNLERYSGELSGGAVEKRMAATEVVCEYVWVNCTTGS